MQKLGPLIPSPFLPPLFLPFSCFMDPWLAHQSSLRTFTALDNAVAAITLDLTGIAHNTRPGCRAHLGLGPRTHHTKSPKTLVQSNAQHQSTLDVFHDTFSVHF